MVAMCIFYTHYGLNAFEISKIKAPPLRYVRQCPPKTPKINKLIKSPNFKECFKMCFWKIKATTYLLNIMKLLSHWRIFKTKQKAPTTQFYNLCPSLLWSLWTRTQSLTSLNWCHLRYLIKEKKIFCLAKSFTIQHCIHIFPNW